MGRQNAEKQILIHLTVGHHVALGAFAVSVASWFPADLLLELRETLT